ncbi:hypothetical protein B1207_13540 [Legionella quinlivanii]|uniref:Uncharacterized protein n=1 Tax=Legionella quinlivanii TaxID=45073 RepID=A0A364LG39_9GAMM|nr:hypothetical protein B1207_13540 [Legionella quinlivanii]
MELIKADYATDDNNNSLLAEIMMTKLIKSFVLSLLVFSSFSHADKFSSLITGKPKVSPVHFTGDNESVH